MIITSDRKRSLVSSAEGSRLDRAVISDEQVLVETIIGNLILDVTLFGERHDIDTRHVVTSMTQRVAPLEKLTQSAQYKLSSK